MLPTAGEPTDFAMPVDGPTGAAGLESKRSERTSIGRPSRKAAEKVQSYKEIPLNLKMRRAN